MNYLFQKFELEYDNGGEGIPSGLADTLRSAKIALLLGPKYAMVEDLRAEIEKERLYKEGHGGLRLAASRTFPSHSEFWIYLIYNCGDGAERAPTK